MKKLSIGVLFVTFIFWVQSFLHSQNQTIRYVDTKLIMEKLPEYAIANEVLANFTKKWDAELKIMKDSIMTVKDDYEKDEIFLTSELKNYRKKLILRLENQYQALEKRYFGYEGELFKKRIELIRPIQDKIYNTIKKIAAKYQFDIVFDKSENNSIIFAVKKIDITTLVLKELRLN